MFNFISILGREIMSRKGTTPIGGEGEKGEGRRGEGEIWKEQNFNQLLYNQKT